MLGGLKDAGADLELVIARRTPEGPAAGVVFVTPLQGDREIAAATDLGFNVTRSVASLRVVGADRPGIAADLTQRLAAEGIELLGLSVGVIGPSFVMHARLENMAEVERARSILEEALEPVPV
jgi:predicted amino acid-binding ACT domain protein